MTESYETLPDLAGLYFEDSYVLGIVEREAELSFDLDLVLTETHPDYRPPIAGEAYCFRRGTLVFAGYDRIEWLERSAAEYTDAAGEVDYGNIDSFRHGDGQYALEGDWGSVEIFGGSYRVTLFGEV